MSGKNHKRRVRLLKEEAHSQKAAEAVVGLGTENGNVGQDSKSSRIRGDEGYKN